MIAIQFQTIKEPVDERDTRDIWQLRQDILKEKKLQSELLGEIRSTEDKIAGYETKRQNGKEKVLQETLEELKTEAGLTKVTGPGIILKIEPVYEEVLIGDPISTTVTPDLLKRLTNELNMYEAKQISIDGQRIINSTVIREISSETRIDGHRLSALPIEIKVVVDNVQAAEKLSNRMKASQSMEEFFIENLRLTVSDPIQEVNIEAYGNPIRMNTMKPAKTDEGGGS
ncbi:NgoFVII family restriction endonuclease [Neobacillus piezotolerans]|uniref:NgoFVII family restriction endonuclease n=2 Tax=Neobacillus piezotolerans TaxID=2259171 RepID=A0A3D8GX08_9BACI|nr:NgoFVII family restriction endonuclease [Neobacillus piezotolerans]